MPCFLKCISLDWERNQKNLSPLGPEERLQNEKTGLDFSKAPQGWLWSQNTDLPKGLEQVAHPDGSKPSSLPGAQGCSVLQWSWAKAPDWAQERLADLLFIPLHQVLWLFSSSAHPVFRAPAFIMWLLLCTQRHPSLVCKVWPKILSYNNFKGIQN